MHNTDIIKDMDFFDIKTRFMKNFYAIQCDVFPMNKIIEVLKYNNFYFLPDNSKPKEGFEGYITISEDKMWFIKRAVLLNHIIIGCTYREDTNDSAFKIYFPNQVINPGFNYNPEFSKKLIGMNDFEFDSSIPITSINLHTKNIDKLISEDDITIENVQARTTKKFKPVNFEAIKKKGIEKLYLYKLDNFWMVIAWHLQGKKNRNTVIYNKSFTAFLMGIKTIELKTPEGCNQKSNKKDNIKKENKPIQNANEINYNSDLEIDNLVNPFKKGQTSKTKTKKDLWIDPTPNIDKINSILDKINKSGIDSLSLEEKKILKNSAGNL